MSFSSRVKQYLKDMVEHGNHHVTLNLFGREIHPCARCLGMYMVFLLLLPVVLMHYYGVFSVNFTECFILCWLMVLPAILDWSTVKLGLRQGDNRMRVITGGLLGGAIVSYLFFLPASWLFRIGTLFIYEATFGTVVFLQHCKEWNVDPIDLLLGRASLKKNVAYGCAPECSCCCECCFPSCNCSACPIAILLTCCCCLPLCCGIPCGKGFLGNKTGKEGGNGGKKKDKGFFSRLINP